MNMENIPKVLSNRGKKIYSEMIKPLLKHTYSYDRVASYYSPLSLSILLNEFAEIWAKNGQIRLIIGFHETMKITPALKSDVEVKDAIRNAVMNAILGNANQLSTILKNNKKNTLSIIKELINQKRLLVTLVTPKVNFESYKKKKKWPNPEIGIFHSKFMIFHHTPKNSKDTKISKTRLTKFSLKNLFYRPFSLRRSSSKFSVITTSMNESVRGYSENIEDAILHHSWYEPDEIVCKHFLNRFEKIWLGEDEDVITMPFTEEFGNVVDTVYKQSDIKYFTWNKFIKLLDSSPIYHCLSFKEVGLLSHQIGVFKEALSRWPIRILLADEVGLGKTIETGALISYLQKFCNVKRIAILTPASLQRQWQKELKEYFKQDFWIYNSSLQTCENDKVSISVGKNPLSQIGKIDNVIISWHWARLGAKEQIRFNKDNLPNLLIVDEAHHARIKENNSNIEKTQLYCLLKEMQRYIPHIILATATPYQTNIHDYFSLLDILGIPENFIDSLQHYTKWVRGEIPDRMNSQIKHLKFIHGFKEKYQLNLPNIKLLHNLENKETTDIKFYKDIIQKIQKIPRNDIIATHPATFLTTRNFRSGLKNLGYGFPKSHFEGFEIAIDNNQSDLLEDIEEYIQLHLGHLERHLSENNKIGLLRSLYKQRMVSSFKAAYDTLKNRENKLQKILNDKKIDNFILNVLSEFNSESNDENDALPDFSNVSESTNLSQSILEIARTELYIVNRLVSKLEKMFTEGKIFDPKLVKLKKLLKEHLLKNHKILVFSRFTSTTSAIIDELKEFYNNAGVGRFDGKYVGIYKITKNTVEFLPCNRKTIIDYLNNGKIKILICSDAASEGLNLHAANVVINVDVPWNPSRLQQRFGRVDRLGQKSENVHLINLYYPNSIEERMYRVLENRRIDFRAVLGEVPEIMSSQQKNIINGLSKGSIPTVNITFEEIDRERKKYLKYSKFGIDTASKNKLFDKSLYYSLSDSILRSASLKDKQIVRINSDTFKIDNHCFSVNPLDENFVSLNNQIFSKFKTEPENINKFMRIYQIENKAGIPLFLALEDKDHIIPITTKDWLHLFDFCFNGKPINIIGCKRFPKNDFCEVMKYIAEAESWLMPNHTKIRTISSTEIEIPNFTEVKIGKYLGSISVIY